MNYENYYPLFIIIIVYPVIFLICRQLVCWYLKTTENVKLLKDIKLLLIEIKNKLPDKEKEKSITEEIK